MHSHRRNVRTLKFWSKSKENKIFIEYIDQGHVRLDLDRKKYKTISCLCTLKLMQFDDTLMISYRCKEIHS
jgi:hypothetical protein